MKGILKNAHIIYLMAINSSYTFIREAKKQKKIMKEKMFDRKLYLNIS